jgi:hypothetical protein
VEGGRGEGGEGGGRGMTVGGSCCALKCSDVEVVALNDDFHTAPLAYHGGDPGPRVCGSG